MINKTFIIIISICLIQLFSDNSFTVEPEEMLKNQKQELRARNISKNIRCMVCQNQSIDESNAPLARDLRILIRNKIKEGNNNEEIYIFLTDRYGDFILLKPPLRLNTLALWFLPFIFFIIGFFIILYHNKKFKGIIVKSIIINNKAFKPNKTFFSKRIINYNFKFYDSTIDLFNWLDKLVKSRLKVSSSEGCND